MNITKLKNIFNLRYVAQSFSHTAFKYGAVVGTSVSKAKGPLADYRVLDMTRILAGPYCSMLLGDLGAEIIKVENPDGGDDTRQWGPPFLEGESTYFFSVNRNKKSVCINIKDKEGAEIVRQLAAKSDILIENYLPHQLHKYNLGYEDIKKVNPALVYCSITGYGQTGPWSSRKGYDVIVSAVGGMVHITGTEEEPCKVGVAITDLSTGLYAHGAVMAALLHRQKTGQGQHIDCNLLSTQVALLVHIGSSYLNAGVEAQRYGTAHGSIVPYEAFKTSDSRIVVGAGNNSQFLDLVKVLGLDALSTDYRYASNSSRVENRESLISILSDRLAKKKTAEWLEILEGCSFPYGPINNIEQVFKNPQVVANGLVQETKHATLGTLKIPGPAVVYSENNTVLQCPPPTLGQHTDEVLNTVLGFDDKYMRRLRGRGVLR